MSDKIKTCKPSLISNRANFSYKLEFTDSTGATWEFGLHTYSAAQKGAIEASRFLVKITNEGKAETEIENNLEKIKTVQIYNALISWNLDEKISVDNINLLPDDVRTAIIAAIDAHENNNSETLQGEIKN